MKSLLFLLSVCAVLNARAADEPVEIHDRLVEQTGPERKVALTLDACGGKYDSDLIEFLVNNNIPATLFTTRKWLDKNPHAMEYIKAHLDLFDVENHGARHIPAVIGKDRTIYGIPAEPDVAHLKREVLDGAQAVEKATGKAPRWYRGATGEYDAQSVREIEKLGFKIAGFSVNADSGATLKKATIEKRLARVKAGDVIIAHMNKPDSDSAEGLAVGLAALLKAGFVFVRLDQVELKVQHEKSGTSGAQK